MPTAAEIIALLKLEPLANEGGFFRQTYASEEVLAGGRPAGTAIYFLITAEGFSALHRLRTEEVWHFYAGDPVEHLILGAGPAARCIRTVLGPSMTTGQSPQLVVPANAWQGARLATGWARPATEEGGGWALLGCTMSPGWDEREFTLGERGALMTEFPEWTADILALTR